MTTTDILHLGNFFFRIESADAVYKQQLTELFVPAEIAPSDALVHCLNVDEPSTISPNWQRYVFSNGKVDIVRVIILRGLEHHGRLMWLDAAVLVTPDGRTVLVTGASCSGKTTTCLALAAGLGWKIANEDITLIDTQKDAIVALSSPMSIRPGTLDRVGNITNAVLPEIGFEKWCSVKNYSVSSDLTARFDACFHIIRNEQDGFDFEQLPPSSYVRQLLSNSNLLKLDATGAFLQCIRGGNCWLIRGGSLEQRIDAITTTLAPKDGEAAIAPLPLSY